LNQLAVAALLGLAAGLFLHGTACLGRLTGARTSPGSMALFLAGLLAVGVALCSPVDDAAASSLTVHMAQHVLLIGVAPPLLVAGRPLVPLLWALPSRSRIRLSRAHRRVAHSVAGRPAAIAAAAVLQTALVWVWHAPPLYQGALRHAAAHGLEHATYLLAGLAFWWAVAGVPRRSTYGAGVLALFVSAFPLTLLGAAMALAHAPWYPVYAHGGAPLESQQLAGVVMWAYGGMAIVAGACALFAGWLAGAERLTPGWQDDAELRLTEERRSR
jgi:putative membrane protein